MRAFFSIPWEVGVSFDGNKKVLLHTEIMMSMLSEHNIKYDQIEWGLDLGWTLNLLINIDFLTLNVLRSFWGTNKEE